MFAERQKIKQLEKEIDLLEAENERLEKEYYHAKETEIYKTAKSYSYRDRNFLYLAIPLSMITTPFYYQRECLAKKATASFMTKILNRTKEQADHALDFNPQIYFAMLCERIITCSQGIMFVLSDPYRTIQTTPVDTMTEEEATEYVGKVVIAKLVIPANYAKENCFALKAIKKTDYTSHYRMDHEDWPIMRKHLNVTGTKECLKALKDLEQEFSHKYSTANDVMKCYGTWISENEFRISTDKRLMCFHVKDGIIWYADEIRKPDDLGPYSIDNAYKTNKCFSELIGNDSGANIPLLLTGEENFELFLGL